MKISRRLLFDRLADIKTSAAERNLCDGCLVRQVQAAKYDFLADSWFPAMNHISTNLCFSSSSKVCTFSMHKSNFSKISSLSTDSLMHTLSVRKIVYLFHPSFLGRTMGKGLTRSQVSQKSSVAFFELRAS